ncbi:MAG: ABC transporter substrate-binding protein, partial [Humidesulfovibrio sp.]|nr:ABC transporter substrate-binding protein [Humidesulfovibrio sp.]
MRKMLLMMVVLACWGSLALAAQTAQAGRMQVAVGVAPVEQFARMIGGELVQTVVLVPAGAD